MAEVKMGKKMYFFNTEDDEVVEGTVTKVGAKKSIIRQELDERKRINWTVPTLVLADTPEAAKQLIIENRKKNLEKLQEREELLHKKKAELRKLECGDKVLLTGGKEAIFFKLNRKKFVGEINGDPYEIPIGHFERVLEKRKVDPVLEEKKDQARKYFGTEIQTSYGPSVVKGFSFNEKSVELLEFGEELYSLSLDDFLAEIKEHNQ